MTTESIYKSSYTNLAIILHWLLACLLLFQLCVGVFMVDIPKGPDSSRALWFNFHKSMGIIIALLVVFRLIWRLKNSVSPLPKSIPGWQRVLSTTNHFSLYLCMLVMPLSGIVGSVFSKYPIKFFGIPLPRLAEPNEIFKTFSSDIHLFFAYAFIFLISIHVIAALKHLFVDCDGVFERMMPK